MSWECGKLAIFHRRFANTSSCSFRFATMNGRDYLTVARELAAGPTEAHWRTAAGRAYYALMIECRDALRRWGFVPAARDNVHTFVRLRLTFAAYPDLKKIGDALDRLVQWRNYADYQLAV